MVTYAIEEPDQGQVRVSNELRKRGVFVSTSGVCSIWLRHDLTNDTDLCGRRQNTTGLPVDE